MKTGEFEFAFLDRVAVLFYQFTCGVPLEATLQDCAETSDLMQQYRVKSADSITMNIQGLMMDLAGRSPDPFAWSSRAPQSGMSTVLLVWHYMRRTQVAYYLRRFDLAEMTLARFVKVWPEDFTYQTVVHGFFFYVLVNAALFRETGKRRYKFRARRKYRWAQKTIQDRMLNNTHKFKILAADMASSFGDEKPSRVKELFDDAIADSLSWNYIQDAALANELAGEYFLRTTPGKDDQFWAKRYLTNAHALYEAWQAKAIVEKLLERRGEFIDLELSKQYHCTPRQVGFLSDSSLSAHDLSLTLSDRSAPQTVLDA